MVAPSWASFCQYIHFPSFAHVILASLTLSPKPLTYAVPLMSLFIILSFLVAPEENLNIFNSDISTSASRLLVSATVSKPNTVTGLATLFKPLLSLLLLILCHASFLTLASTISTLPELTSLPVYQTPSLNPWTFPTSTLRNLTVPLASLSFTHAVFCVAASDFHSLFLVHTEPAPH